MSAITPHYRSVQQLLQSQSFSIDEYQREYKWEKENIDELLSDLRVRFYSYSGFNEGTANAGVTPLARRISNDQRIRAHSSGA